MITVFPPGLEHESTAEPYTRADRVVALFQALRPRQWSKNLIAVPLSTIGTVSLTGSLISRLAWAVALFILSSSLVYILNDVHDRHRDRLHPAKLHRPIASGRVSVRAAWLFAALLGVALIGLTAIGPWRTAWVVAGYLLLNLAYTRWFKHKAIVDVIIVATGFVLRVMFGAIAAGVAVSNWLILAIFSFSLLMCLGKRRHELGLGTGDPTNHRPALMAYSPEFVNSLMVLASGLGFGSYASYLCTDTISQPFGQILFLLSMPLTIFGLFRYIQILVIDGGGGDPTETLLRDRSIVIAALLGACCVPLAAFLSTTAAFSSAFF
ncbi:MAG: decaprenyl-phosphate phosphoribosyltransferase [Dactylosporangium sp.]|nr:decaprenyl-phosphate phosphoribosyltransferase [Dactylosporangium sp.]NNJ62981.1 decaprenyl-phosphate phosphoribosyltransferase [Dactylosporangium sp.]